MSNQKYFDNLLDELINITKKYENILAASDIVMALDRLSDSYAYYDENV